ncbi:carboxymuconolactone decarboxylase family protein [Demequina salsinemoris]|uniref:carboxymuconolactone decarboxylase family protein n=1 Tax=Demequina salsinemoris TaxID=577470 RepID=UPI0007860FC9|nr:carboxymuconolactone decarboxylase family protein [Demequina salsinemoris]
MARIDGVPGARAGVGTRILYFFSRRGLSRAAGRSPARMLEPLEIYAHAPGLLRAYARLEQATARMDAVEPRLMALATVKASTLVSCEYCIDLGSQILRAHGLTDEELLALPEFRTSPVFDAMDRLVMEYAVGMSSTPARVSDELYAELAARLTSRALVELTHQIALENMRGRYGVAFDLEAAGFSEGAVCAIPLPPGQS